MAPTTSSIPELLQRVHEEGYVVLTRAIPEATVAAARAALRTILDSTPVGRTEFEGFSTRRIYALFAKTRALDALATHDVVLALLDGLLGTYQLSAPAGISIGPGEKAQRLHRDDAIYPVPRPHPHLVVNAMWALDDFTPENGGTCIVPRSHTRTDDTPPPDSSVVSVSMPAGSALVYVGSLWHGGGANRTTQDRLGVALHYAAGWLRAAENFTLAVPPVLAATLPARMQELLGYNIAPPFLGNVDGRHPRKLLR
jgi:ectoine hydroxylase-related dioxygenase (phytanoyl-CoA dioxygenase family)